MDFEPQEKTHLEKQKALLRRVIWFCHRHPGVAVESGGPGARDGNARLAKYFVRRCTPVRMQKKDGWCSPGAIVNGVDCLKGSEAAEKAKAMLLENEKQFQNLKQIGGAVSRLDIKFEVKKVKIAKLPKEVFEWLGGLSCGVG